VKPVKAHPQSKCTLTPNLEGMLISRKEWRVGKRLGGGACGQINECFYVGSSTLSVNKNMEFIVKTAQLPRVGTEPKMSKVVKKNMEQLANTLYYETIIYNTVCRPFPDFPVMMKAGDDNGVRYIIMERLGISVGDELVRLKNLGERMTLKSIADVGHGVLRDLKALHSRGYSYRDMKSENIMLGKFKKGIVQNKNEARLIDFGIVAKFTSALTGEHAESVVGKVLDGTGRFIGVIRTRDMVQGSRSDDIEGLANVLICAACNDWLPWDTATNEESFIKRKMDLLDPSDMMNACREMITPGAIEPLKEFIRVARNMKFDETPSYTLLHSLLDDLSN
jgi:serine/threonine protein kinase